MRIAAFFSDVPGTIGRYLSHALRGLGHTLDQFDIGRTDRCAGGYDLYLRIDHGDYAKDLPDRLSPRAFYIVDAHLARSWKHLQRQARRYDVVFCAQRLAAERLARAHWVPLACDPEVHGAPPERAQRSGTAGASPALRHGLADQRLGTASPTSGSAHPLEKRYDIAFVGTDGGVPRKLVLQELRERFPSSFIGRAPSDQMAALYSQSKIGFHYIECTSPLKDHVSMRVYEVLASGTMLLANALEPGAFDGVGLRDRQELVVYRTLQELFELARYFLDHDAERERIASAGCRVVLERHTYRHRAAAITDILSRELGLR